jgi:hypothetical protein
LPTRHITPKKFTSEKNLLASELTENSQIGYKLIEETLPEGMTK